MSGPSKADLERTIDRLRAERDDARNSYAELVKEKTLYAQSSGSLLFELGESYPSLAETVSWLYKAHHAASALPEKTGGSKTADSHHVADPAGDKAAAEDGDTARLKRIDGKLAAISAFIRDHLGERGPLPDRLAEKPPVCHNPDCPAEGWPQAWDAEVCVTCGDPFGAHRPKPRRFDTEAPEVKPCWKRGCAMRGRIRSCVHSI